MTLQFETYALSDDADSTEVREGVLVENDADLYQLRHEHVDWHEGALSLLTYPSKLVGFLSHELPKAMTALGFETPVRIGKDAAGNFHFLEI